VFAPLLALAHEQHSVHQMHAAVAMFFQQLTCRLSSDRVMVPSLFHRRYTDTAQELDKRENAFLLKAVQSYADEHFSSEGELSPERRAELVTVTAVLRYLRSHFGHLDNSLVGLQPSEFALAPVVPFSQQPQYAADRRSGALSTSAASSASPKVATEQVQCSGQENTDDDPNRNKARQQLGAHRQAPAKASTTAPPASETGPAETTEANEASALEANLERYLLTGNGYDSPNSLSLDRLATAVYELGLLGEDHQDGPAVLQHLALLARALSAAAPHGKHATLRAGQLVLVRLTSTQYARKQVSASSSSSSASSSISSSSSSSSSSAASSSSSSTETETSSLYFARVVTPRIDQRLRLSGSSSASALDPAEPTTTSGVNGNHHSKGASGAVASVLDRSRLLMRSVSLSSYSRNSKRDSSSLPSKTVRSSKATSRMTGALQTQRPTATMSRNTADRRASMSPSSSSEDPSSTNNVDATVDMLMRRTLEEPSEVAAAIKEHTQASRGRQYLVTLDPYEVDQHLQFAVRRSAIRTLPDSLFQLISRGHCSRLCNTALPEIYSAISQLLCARRKEFLVSRGVAPQLIDRLMQPVHSDAFSVADFPMVRALSHKLDRILDPRQVSSPAGEADRESDVTSVAAVQRPSLEASASQVVSSAKMLNQFVDRLYAEASQRLEEMLLRLNCREMLRSDQVSALSALNRYRSTLRSTIVRSLSQPISLAAEWRQALQERMRALLDGREKRLISDWWLHLIETRTQRFLLDAGYHQHSHPANYIEYPPADMRLVRDNLHLLSCVLDPRNSRYRPQVRRFVRELATEIYARLGRFVAETSCVFCIELLGHRSIDPAASSSAKDAASLANHTSLEDLRLLVKRHGSQLQSAQLKLLENCLDDMQYVRTMHEMEANLGFLDGGSDDELPDDHCDDAADPSLHKLELTAVVPVSGLIMSAFVRLQKELETVEEVWCLPDEEPSTTSSSSSYGSLRFGDQRRTAAQTTRRTPARNVDDDQQMASLQLSSDDDEADDLQNDDILDLLDPLDEQQKASNDGQQRHGNKDADDEDEDKEDLQPEPFSFMLSSEDRKWLPPTYQSLGRQHRRLSSSLHHVSQALPKVTYRLSFKGNAVDLPPAPPPPIASPSTDNLSK